MGTIMKWFFIRIPYAAKWPAAIPAGVDYDPPTSSLDILATIAAANGIKEDPERPLDGADLIPYINGEKEGIPHERIYIRKFDQNWFSITHRTSQLFITSKPASKLYDLPQQQQPNPNLEA